MILLARTISAQRLRAVEFIAVAIDITADVSTACLALKGARHVVFSF